MFSLVAANAGPVPRPLGMGWVGAGPLSRKDSPPGMPWGYGTPGEDEFAKDPPGLPPHLRVIVLNEAAPAVPSILGGSAAAVAAAAAAAGEPAAAAVAAAAAAGGGVTPRPGPGGVAAAAGAPPATPGGGVTAMPAGLPAAPPAPGSLSVHPMTLSTPLPVCLGHLYCTAIKDGIIVQALSLRYRRKFSSVVFYARMPLSSAATAEAMAALQVRRTEGGGEGQLRRWRRCR